DVSELITEAINQLRRGQLEPRIANGVGYLASVLLRSFEQGLIEQRISKLEWSLGMIQSPLIRPYSEGRGTGLLGRSRTLAGAGLWYKLSENAQKMNAS